MKKHRQVSRGLLAVAACVAVLLAACALGRAQRTRAAVPDYVWWEAESPAETNFPPPDRHEFAPANPAEAAVLSGGRWIGVGGPRSDTRFLVYDVRVPAGGQWQLYARKFWQHGPFRWRFDDQSWRQVGRNVALLDNESLRQFVGANWVHVGAAQLAPGTHRLRIELTENEGAAAFDAFVLTRRPFTPRGRMKPGEKYARAPAGWFPFEPDPDPFAASPIDLRSLNEKTAGENGFIRVRGGQFVGGGTGRPVRFWAVNAGPGIARMDNASLDHLARFLAKRGVNMVRYHGAIYEGSGPNFGKIDPGMVDRVQYLVAAMKRQGIYTTLSIYFPLWVRLDEKQGWAGYTDRIPFSLLFFSPEFQKIYRGWWRALLAPKNPYTGAPLSRDPAVAALEMVNEDSYFFWTFTPYENVPAPQMAVLEKQFGDWLTKKYGSVGQALAGWGGGPVRGDDAAAGRAGFMPLWEIFNKRDRRAQDTAAFLTESQRRFFQTTRAYLKRDLGCGGMVYGSNWVTASAPILGPLDKYANTAGDFLDRHGYFGGPHEGERASYSISAGDRYDDRSALLFTATGKDARPGDHDFDLPIFDLFYNHLPSTITEINWPLPNRYRADLPLLAAAYGALQGSNGLFFFALSTPGWQNVLDSKFGIQSPAVIGQFPATALLYRKGLVAAAPEVVTVDLNLGDLRALKGVPVTAPQNLDALRAADIPAGGSAGAKNDRGLDPRAFLVGRVAMNFTEKPGRSRSADLSRRIDDGKRIVRSATGQLVWDYGAGRVTVNAPQAQGVTGFLRKEGPYKSRDAVIDAKMEYGTVLLVALDNRPLAASGKILLQVMSEEQNYGWSAPGSGLRAIRSTGGPPIVVRRFAGAVSLRRPDAARLRVTPLDFNGYRKRPVGSAKAISLLPDTLYYLIERP